MTQNAFIQQIKMLKNNNDKSNTPFSHSNLKKKPENLMLSTMLFRKHNIILTKDIFNEKNFALDNLLRGKSPLFILSEKIWKLYGKKISVFLQNRKNIFDSQLYVTKSGEENKNLQTVISICEHANNIELKRDHPIVAVGGGTCLDICGLVAALFRRGVPHIKIPTTFVGLIDAGIATKNGINLGKKKNLLGTFYPPEASIIDSTFLATLPLRYINCGIAESLKMGLIADGKLFKLWLDFGVKLQSSCLQQPENINDEIIRRSIVSMLEELSDNLYEHNTYKRAVDFGHSFSQYIEQSSNYQVLHGEAVAIDMAISCQISYLKGLIDQQTLEEILNLFTTLKLPIFDPVLNLEHLWASLSSIIAHRGGNLNLVIPCKIGSCVFVENLIDLDKSCLSEALNRLEICYNENRCYSMDS
ncbi:MAG: sedoheptulose 7-phosphate cyclase [Parachlamydiales bacterium]|jgi:3-dehydroquinate synthase